MSVVSWLSNLTGNPRHADVQAMFILNAEMGSFHADRPSAVVEVGASASEIVGSLPSLLPAVSEFQLRRYQVSKGFAEEAGHNIENELELEFALNALTSSDSAHVMSVDATSLSNRLVEIRRELQEGEAVAITSRVRVTSGEILLMPLLDFDVPPSPSNQQLVVSGLRQAWHVPGFLLESGRSYHFYGLRLFAESEWIDLMAASLLLSGLVDTRYIAHRLLDRAGSLRIASSHRKSREPRVVEILDEGV